MGALIIGFLTAEGQAEQPHQPSASPPAAANTNPTQTAEGLKQEELAIAQRMFKDFPDRSDPLALLGNVYNRHGNSTEAVRCWEECLRRNPNRADAYDGLATVARRKGEYEKAVALWQKALAMDPTLPSVYGRLGGTLIDLGRLKEAIAALEKDVQVSPSALSCCLLGQAHLQSNDSTKAKGYYEKAVKLDPNLTTAYYGLSVACTRLGEKEQAQEYLTRFRKCKAADYERSRDVRSTAYDLGALRQGLVQTCTDAGRFYRGRGYLLKAEQHWKRAAELDPNSTACRMELVMLYQQNRRQREALDVCAEVVALEPDNPLHYLKLGVLHAQLKDDDAAEKAFQKVVEMAPRRSEGYLALAQLYLRGERNLANAKALAAKAMELDPNNPECRKLRAELENQPPAP